MTAESKNNESYLPSRSVVTTLSSMGYFLDGYDLSVIAVFTLVLTTYKIFPYDAFSEGFVSGSALLGAFVGAVVFGHYSDKIGRRYLYIFDLIFFAVFAILSAFATNLIELIIFRFFIGWGVGADYALSPVYTTEMYSNKERGSGYGWVWTFWSIGAAFSFLVAYLFYLSDPLTSWRWALGLGAIPAVIVVILRTRMPESARWNIVNNGNVDAHIKRVSEKVGISEGDIIALLEERKREAEIAAGSASTLFKGEYGKRTAIVWIQWILYDIAGYGIGLYSPVILGSFGLKGATTLILSFAFYMPVGFLGAYGAVRLNDKVGRRPLQAAGFASMAIAMLLFYIASVTVGSILVVLGILAFILDYGMGNLGPGNTMGLYAIELLPTKLRSSSMGNATGITRIVSFLSAFLFPIVSTSLGKSTFFAILLALMMVAFIFTMLYTPETKGLTLEEIAIASYKRINGKPQLVLPSAAKKD
ncbi:MAG: MFS transporter [Thermoplasmatales archaeon B_DKE]|nr:MAG: MFS transporter [Thermoplasmatales archaeon B_DKE]